MLMFLGGWLVLSGFSTLYVARFMRAGLGPRHEEWGE